MRGGKHGQGYGKLLERLSAETTETGRERHKLFQLAKKAALRAGCRPSRIRRNNLGRQTLRVKRDRGEAAVETVVGQAVRQARRSHPAVAAVEDRSHLRGRTRSRRLSRIVSRWARSALRERLEFRSRAGSSRLETVNAAYTRQRCPDPTCGYVHKENRHGDKFHGSRCGRAGDADVVAATNPLARVDDAEVHGWTPVEPVKRILDGRFRRRKQTRKRVNDPGNGTRLPAGLPKTPGDEPGPNDGDLTATEAVWNAPQGRSSHNKEKPVQLLASAFRSGRGIHVPRTPGTAATPA